MNPVVKLTLFMTMLLALFFAGLAVGSVVGTDAPPAHGSHVDD